MSGFENTPHVRYYTTDKNHHKNNIGKNFSFALHIFSLFTHDIRMRSTTE